MAAEIVNLRQARKRQARSEKESAAERNRFEHGRTRREKNLTAALNRKAAERLEAGRIEQVENPSSDENSGNTR